jgi:alpha-1,3-rhamnosyltransferase
MMNEPLVSVCIPVYNHECYLTECIDSVINQKYHNIELLIINDGSTDDSETVIQKSIDACQQRFVRFEFLSRSNKGLATTLNEAISWARGEFFSAIASDDHMLELKTSLLVNTLTNDVNSAAAFGACISIDGSGKKLFSHHVKSGVFHFEDVFTRKCHICTPSQMIRLSDLKRTGGYRSDLFIEDLYMWLKLTSLGKTISVIKEPVVAYRLHDSNSHKNVDKMHHSIIKIIDEYKNHPAYARAKSTSYLRFAGDLARENKTRSLKFVLRSICQWPLILTLPYFYKNVARLFLPSAVLTFLLKA